MERCGGRRRRTHDTTDRRGPTDERPTYARTQSINGRNVARSSFCAAVLQLAQAASDLTTTAAVAVATADWPHQVSQSVSPSVGGRSVGRSTPFVGSIKEPEGSAVRLDNPYANAVSTKKEKKRDRERVIRRLREKKSGGGGCCACVEATRRSFVHRSDQFSDHPVAHVQ